MNGKIGWTLITASLVTAGCAEILGIQDLPSPSDAGTSADAYSLADADTSADASYLADAGACEPGHGGDNCEPLDPFAAPNGEGGEVRIELFQEGEGSTRLAVQAFFFKEQEPLLRPMVGDPIADPANNQGYVCFQYKAGEYYNNGANARHQEIADSRTYIDVGETITLTNRADNYDVIVLSKSTDPDPSNRIQHGVLYVGDETYEPTPASLYGWELDGTSDEYIAFNLLNGASLATSGGPVPEEYRPDVYFPQQFTMTSPAEADYFAGPVTFTKGESLAIQWENVGDEHADFPGTVSFVGFVTENSEVESWCLRGGDEGQFIVPPEILEYVSPTGQLLVGKLAHTAWLQAQNEDNTRIDLVGVNSKLSSYEIVEP